MLNLKVCKRLRTNAILGGWLSLGDVRNCWLALFVFVSKSRCGCTSVLYEKISKYVQYFSKYSLLPSKWSLWLWLGNTAKNLAKILEIEVSFRQKVNSLYYLGVLKQLRENVRRKRPELYRNKYSLEHHDNTSVQIGIPIKQVFVPRSVLNRTSTVQLFYISKGRKWSKRDLTWRKLKGDRTKCQQGFY